MVGLAVRRGLGWRGRKQRAEGQEGNVKEYCVLRNKSKEPVALKDQVAKCSDFKV